MTVYLRKKKIIMADALNEMASDKTGYENKLSGTSMQLYQHLIFICVLEEQLPEMVSHWSNEIYNFTHKAISTELKAKCRNLNRVKVIEDEMMEPQMGVHFEDYDVSQFISALNTEKRKAKNQLKDSAYKKIWPLLRKEINCIDESLKHINDYVEPSKSRIESFYNKFKDATSKRDIDLLKEAIEEFSKVKS